MKGSGVETRSGSVHIITDPGGSKTKGTGQQIFRWTSLFELFGQALMKVQISFCLFLIGDREGERETEIAEGMEIKR
jgi:hypothetical protein